MKRIKILFSLIAFVAIMMSCNKEDSYSSETGTGHIVLGGIMLDSETLSVSSSTSRSGDGSDNTPQNVREVNNDDFKNGFNVTMKYHDEEVFKYVMTQEEIDSMQKKDDEGTDTEGDSESEGSESTGENNTVVDWNDLMKPVELRAGTYLVSVSFSDLSKEGFDMPCYIGEENITLKKDETKTIENITCSLANSIFNVNYTDAFKEYFTDYNVSMITSYGNEIVFAKDETRDAYLSPGKIDIYVTAKREGQSEAKYKLDLSKISDSTPEDGEDTDEDISNGVFKAKRKYTITLDVNADKAILEVSFSDEVSEEKTVSIDVSDVALNAKAPVMTGNNLVSGELVEIIEGSVGNEKYAVAINAEGVIKECILTTKSQYLLDKGWPARVDLASSEIPEMENKNKLKEFGLDIKGLTTNIDQFAWVDFSNVINSVAKDNQINLNLSVTDRFGKTSVNDFVVSATTTACDFTVAATKDEAKFLGNTCMVDASFIKGNPNNIKFSLEDGKVLNIVETQKVEGGSDGKEHHRVTLQGGSDIQFINPFNVKAKYLDYDLTAENLPVSIGILLDNGEGDVWAKRAYLHVYNDDMQNLKVQRLDGDVWTDIAESEISGTNIIAKGLASGTKQQLRVVKNGTEETNVVDIVTEEELQLPNAGFENWYSEMVFNNKVTFPGNKDIYSFYPYLADENDKWWTTNNAITTKDPGCTSWYYAAYPAVVPTNATETHTALWHIKERYNNISDFGVSSITNDVAAAGNTSMEISTVGHGDNNWSAFGHNTQYRTAGKLFIGNYSTDGSENLGHKFNSRPLAFKFTYKFYPYKGEETKAYIAVYDENKQQIGYGNIDIIDAADRYIDTKNIDINYSNTKKCASYITVVFMSSSSLTPGTKDIQGSDDMFSGYGDSRHIGSVFVVDNVELIY